MAAKEPERQARTRLMSYPSKAWPQLFPLNSAYTLMSRSSKNSFDPLVKPDPLTATEPVNTMVLSLPNTKL